MSELIEKLALALFWKAEHLDPSSLGGPVEELEKVCGVAWPPSLSERERDFNRYLARAILLALEAEGMVIVPMEMKETLLELAACAHRDLSLNQSEEDGGYWSLRTEGAIAKAKEILEVESLDAALIESHLSARPKADRMTERVDRAHLDDGYFWVRHPEGTHFVAKHESGQWFACGLRDPIDLDTRQIIGQIKEPLQ